MQTAKSPPQSHSPAGRNAPVVSGLYEATVARAFSAWYGRLMRRIDERGLARIRSGLLAEAHGRVLDLGTGTGSNLPLFADAVDLVCTEPSPNMLRALRRRLASERRTGVDLIQAGAETLPFGDSSFDCVTSTLVMCTMPDPRAGLEEIARVLKPGGTFLFLEHVRSADPRVARAQDRLERPWRFLADGCHCNRDSLATIEASPLTLGEVDHGRMPLAPRFMAPLVYGKATLEPGGGTRG
jgi:SAM-dependent methyltransferase